MRRLMLLRHAKTQTEAPSGRDFDRELDARGVADAEQIGRWLAAQDHPPQRVLISTATRARQTWQHLSAALSTQPETSEVESLYNATPSELLRVVRSDAGDAAALMIVAHNPGLHELAIGMTGHGDQAGRRALENNLPTAGLVVLDFDAESWDEIGFRRGCLSGFISPKTLRDSEPQDS